MELMQVYIPEKRNRQQELMGHGQNAMQGYGMGKGIGKMFAGGGTKAVTPYGGTTGAGTKAGEYGLNAQSSYTPYDGPEYLSYTGEEAVKGSGVETAAGAGGEEALMYEAGSAGPIGLMAATGAFHQKANDDYRRKGDKAGNAPYANQDGSPSIHWDTGTIARRMGSLDDATPDNWTQARKDLDKLNIPEIDKADISKKLTQGLNLSKLLKIG